MYRLLELLTVIGVVGAVMTFLFMVSVAASFAKEGMRSVLGYSTRHRQAASFSTAIAFTPHPRPSANFPKKAEER
jgi:hypothetical protein